jgi:hypothetical protein
VSRLAAWAAARLRDLSPRERRLAMVAGITAAAVLVVVVGIAVRDDVAALRARVAAREQQLAEVRRLAAVLHRRAAPRAAAPDAPSLLARLEVIADGVVGRDRIASMTPASAPADAGLVEERVSLRVGDASLAETVGLLHALAAADPAVGVRRLELRKHPDDPRRFDATLETVQLRGAP